MSDNHRIAWVDKTAFAMPLLPPELGIDPVLAGLIHCIAFLELSGDNSVDPDWAIEAMEHVATYMQRLSPAAVHEVARQLAVIGAHARSHGANSEFVSFIDGLLESCGVVNEGAP